MFLNPETTISLIVGVVFLIVMTLIYFIKEHNPLKVPVQSEPDKTDSEDEELD